MSNDLKMIIKIIITSCIDIVENKHSSEVNILLIEELSELIQAISKLQRFDKYDNTLRCNYRDIYNNIYEELADVIIMLFQFIYKNKLSQENLLNEITKKLIRFYETKQE